MLYFLQSLFLGIQLTQSVGNDLSCNGVKNTHSGLYFNGNNYPTLTYKNTMENHRYGFVLDNSAVIGQQGTNTVPADNFWMGTWSATGTPNGNFKNACLNGSNTNFSKMYVRGSGIYTPMGSTIFILGGYPYNSTSTPVTLFTASNPQPDGGMCYETPPGGGSSSLVPGSGIEETNTETTAMPDFFENSNSVLTSTTNPDQEAVLRNQLLRVADLSETSSSAGVLSSLQQATALSSMEALWEVEKDLVAGNTAGAAAENNALNPSNQLETSYKEYYKAYIRHQNGLFDVADSMLLVDLAQGCPALQGGVVFQAAALYNRVYHLAEVFTPVCSGMVGRGMQEEITESTHYRDEYSIYSLNPIPNDGSFTLRGNFEEGDMIMILNINGEVFEKRLIDEKSSEIKMVTNLLSGTYIFVLINKSKIEKYRSKIVVIK